MRAFVSALILAWTLGLIAAPAGSSVRVVVVAGQSNAVGFGSSADELRAPQRAPRADILLRFEEGLFSAVSDPSQRIRSSGFVPLAYQTDPSGATFGGLGDGFGPELQLGRQVADVTNDTVAVVKFALNATSLAVDWNPTTAGSLFDQMAAQVDSALADLASMGHPGRVRGCGRHIPGLQARWSLIGAWFPRVAPETGIAYAARLLPRRSP